MEAGMDINRKAFLVQLIGSGWVLTGCGGGGGDSAPAPPPAPPPPGGGCVATISDNHGHSLTISAADLNSTVSITYDIHGSADHTHSVTFTAAQLAQLKAGTAVAVTSSTAFAHDHRISEQCS
jgi:hypothetical protein